MAAHDAFTILNVALNRLLDETTPDGFLNAISDYPRSQGATGGQLYYIDSPGNLPEWGEIVASWHTTPKSELPVGTRREAIAKHVPVDEWAYLKRPFIVPSVTNHAFTDDEGRQWAISHHVQAFVQLPMYHNGYWLGSVMFVWERPVAFSDTDVLIYTAIQQQIIPVVESSRLLAQSRAQTQELARVNDEIYILYTTIQQLNLAQTSQEQLEAISIYPRQRGATQGVLSFIDNPNIQPIRSALTVAEWVTKEVHRVGIGARFETLQMPFVKNLLVHPARAALIENLQTDESVGDFRAIGEYYGVKSAVMLPISSNGRWIAFIWFSWDTPQVFTEMDRQIYNALLPQAAGVLDSLQLLKQAHQRTVELEAANSEFDMLYRTSEAINSANTYMELLEAVAPLDPEADAIAVMIWENFDYRTAAYIEPVALLKRDVNHPLNAHDHLPKPGFPICEVMFGERVWLFEDMHNDPRVDQTSLQSFDMIGSRAFLGTAVYVNKRWIGGITFHSVRARDYSQREVRLFAAIGDLVLASFQRIRLQDEKETARHRAELIAGINGKLTRATDEASILKALVPYIETRDANAIVLSYTDTDESSGEQISRPIATWSKGSIQIHPPQKQGDQPPVWAELFLLSQKQPNQPLFIENTVEDERINAETRVTFLQPRRARTLVLLPLVAGGHHYGSLRVMWTKPHVFSAEEVFIFMSLMQTLPNVVASHRSFLAEHQRALEFAAVAKVSAAAASILDERELLQAIHSLTNDAFTDYHFVIYLLDDNEQRELRNVSVADSAAIPVQSPLNLISEVAHTRRSNMINDIQRATMYRFAPVRRDIKAIMAVPLVVSDRLIGVLEIQSGVVNRFSYSDKRVMETLGDMIAVAIQNARLYRQAQSYAALQERNRLARELHDSVSQALYGITLGTQTARARLDTNPDKLDEPLDYILSLAEAALAEMRALIFELRPETLEKEGLIEALNKQAVMLKARYGFSVQTNLCPEPSVPLAIKEAVYWIAREAMHNVIKHARATRIDLTAIHDAAGLQVCIADDGIGFDITRDFTGHLGLRSMHERCQQIGGRLAIISESHHGCEVSITIPPAKTIPI